MEENKTITIKKSSAWKYSTFILLAAAVIGYFMLAGSGKGNAGEDSAAAGEDAQKITLSMKQLNYYPNTIEVESGKPVEITLDSSVRGCYRSFVIKAFNVQKYSKSPEDKIVFTPNKKGTFAFSCSMGMGTGKIIVK